MMAPVATGRESAGDLILVQKFGGTCLDTREKRRSLPATGSKSFR